MKINRFKNLVAAAISLAAFSSAGCAEKEKSTNAPMPSANELTAAKATTAKVEPAKTAQASPTGSADAASATWNDVKDCTYEARSTFFAGLKQLEAKVDTQIMGLNAKRAAMTSDVNTKDWDFAMKEMGDSRSFLKSVGEELSKASVETWTQQKEVVGQAWLRTQAAYDKVKSSTTN